MDDGFNKEIIKLKILVEQNIDVKCEMLNLNLLTRSYNLGQLYLII